MKTLIKGISVDGEIIHKNFKETFYHVGEKTKHAPLECCGSIIQSKGHALVSKGSERAGGTWSFPDLLQQWGFDYIPSTHLGSNSTRVQPGVRAFGR